MPGGLGRSSGFHSDLNRGCRNLSRWEIEGRARVCVCVCVYVCRTVFFSGTWKLACCLCTLAYRGERIKKATMS